jgi:hypothetical protein
MNEKILFELLNNKDKLDERIDFYLKKGILTRQKFVESEILGHKEKAEHNLNFSADVLDKTAKFKYVIYYTSV